MEPNSLTLMFNTRACPNFTLDRALSQKEVRKQ